MSFLRLILNTAGIWWFLVGLPFVGWLANTMPPRSTLVGVAGFVWMIGIIPACVLSAQSSASPMNDLRAAWYAFKQWSFIMLGLFGVGLGFAAVIWLASLGAS